MRIHSKLRPKGRPRMMYSADYMIGDTLSTRFIYDFQAYLLAGGDKPTKPLKKCDGIRPKTGQSSA